MRQKEVYYFVHIDRPDDDGVPVLSADNTPANTQIHSNPHIPTDNGELNDRGLEPSTP